MRNVLIFDLEADFREDLQLVANNEHDLREYLTEKGYIEINFSDLDTSYGSCSLKDTAGFRETAKCKYAKII